MTLLRTEGYVVALAERWIPGRTIRVDMLGVGDLLACRPGDRGPLLVQVTTNSNLSARISKARAEPRLHALLGCGGRFQLHGWFKRHGRWQVRRVALRAGDLEPVELSVRRRRPRRPQRGERQQFLFDTAPGVQGERQPGDRGACGPPGG
jgi:hypothetical protein